jgi:hypothetical protein
LKKRIPSKIISFNLFSSSIDLNFNRIIHLSLRYSDISDTGAERLANALGNISTQNGKLLTLNLSGNRIGDRGATSLATVLNSITFEEKKNFFFFSRRYDIIEH